MRTGVGRSPWVRAPLVGAAVGLLALGVGGRVAMRLVALESGQPPLWTVGGTVTVVALGVANGAFAGLLRAALARWTPRRLGAHAPAVLFALACLLLTLRGLSPLEPVRLALFLPLVVLYVAGVELAWRHLHIAPDPPRASAESEAVA